LFRESVRSLLRHGLRDLYIFGTAGEGHAVDDAQFRSVVDAFMDEMTTAQAPPMVGVMNMSVPTVISRIEYGAERGCRVFQISLPYWSPVNDRELKSFFVETCGRFPEFSFLHYNVARSARMVQPAEYRALADGYPNLVATKYGGGDPELIAGLSEQVPELRHFFTELGFFYGSVLGECGLLASICSTNPKRAREYFDSAVRGDIVTSAALFSELAGMMGALRRAVGTGPHLDGAFDKILSRVADERFPLALLPPWEQSSEAAWLEYRQALRDRFPAWLHD
jgi:dihydrodipicolinate synthase/N-acetylneuraminate lyase